MAHEIGRRDTAIFSERSAWHGLGTVLEEAPTLEDGLIASGLDWEVVADPIFRARDGTIVRDHVEAYRKDNGLPLGIVGKDFAFVQNKELFQIARGIAGLDKDLRVETAFSMRNCRRVLVTIRADEFCPQPNDNVKMYLVCANGHDGSLTLTTYFSSIRVVCANTFRASVAAARNTDGFIRMRHEGDMEAKIQEAQRILSSYRSTFNLYRDKVDSLVKRKITKDELAKLATEAITLMEGKIPTEDEAKKAKRAATKRGKCILAFKEILRNFDRESAELRCDRSAWMGFNACTEWMQHGRIGRVSTDVVKARDNKVFADQFGTLADAKERLWDRALALV